MGIPGVRLATLTGLLVETDGFGRYHLAGIDVAKFDRGRNFMLKVDPSTLPDNSRFTTENPRTMRITQGLMNRFNFGVRLPSPPQQKKVVSMQLGELFFDQDSDEIRPEYQHLLSGIAQKVEANDGALIQIAGFAGTCAKESLKPDEFTFSPRYPVLSTVLSPEDRALLNGFVDGWKRHKDLRIEVVGHTSNVPISPRNRHLYADNYALGKARAETVAEFLAAGLGMDRSDVVALSRGPDEPIASNETRYGRSLNRRIDIAFAYAD